VLGTNAAGDYRLQLRGLEFNVRIVGHGAPMLWGHGLMGSLESEQRLGWFGWQQPPPGVQLVRYDARGHGASQASYSAESYTWPNLAEDMLALADAMEAERFIAGGASMGCVTALSAALKAPHRVRALVLVFVPNLWEARPAQARSYKISAAKGRLLGGKALAWFMSRTMPERLPPWLLAAQPAAIPILRYGIGRLRARTLWHLLRGAAQSNLPPREQLATVAHIPTTILTWTADPAHPVAMAEELHRLLPRSELFIARSHADFLTFPARIAAFAAGLPNP
jgi:pimeloyl-ACP methyl ester carboxylesterase